MPCRNPAAPARASSGATNWGSRRILTSSVQLSSVPSVPPGLTVKPAVPRRMGPSLSTRHVPRPVFGFQPSSPTRIRSSSANFPMPVHAVNVAPTAVGSPGSTTTRVAGIQEP